MKVGIVILNYKSAEDTIRLIQSLNKITYTDTSLVIIDNDSKDGSLEKIEAAFPKLDVLQTDRNLGFAGGVNFGIKVLLEKSIDAVLTLNPDVLVTSNFLEPLVATLTSDTSIAMVSPKIYRLADLQKHEKRIWGIGGLVDWSSGTTYMEGQDEIDKGQFNTRKVFERLPGSCLLIRKQTITDIGMLPEEYFMYFEEVDFCVRANKNGYKCVYEPTSIVYHEGGGVAGSDSPKREYYFARNRLLFAQNFPNSTTKSFIPKFAWEYGKKIVRFLIYGKVRHMRAVIKGILDGIKGHRGEGPAWLG